MPQFIALIQKRADGTYSIKFPDLPDCVVAANVEANILDSATAALTLYFATHELRPFDPAADMTDLALRFAADIKAGAYLQVIPFDAGPDLQRIVYGVPVRELVVAVGKSIPYVTVSDMRPETAKRFLKDIAPCACPTIPGEEAFYAHDWERWARVNLKLADRHGS
ncbi:type II toxin-antitoxin system HicB family antitoxin [Aliiroseovarius sp. CAU 1755]